MQAHEIMSRDVVTVGPDATVQEIAEAMAERAISGVPVVSAEGQIVGIVSESDLLRRADLGTERRRKSWLRAFVSPDRMARDYAKAHGLHARDVMQRHVVTVTETADLGEIADALETHGVKRLPVLRDGRLVGVVSRGDVVRALGRLRATPAPISDEARLERRLLDRLRNEAWLEGSSVTLTLKADTVEVRGWVRSEDQRAGLRALIEETSGGRRVEDQLVVGRGYTTIY